MLVSRRRHRGRRGLGTPRRPLVRANAAGSVAVIANWEAELAAPPSDADHTQAALTWAFGEPELADWDEEYLEEKAWDVRDERLARMEAQIDLAMRRARIRRP